MHGDISARGRENHNARRQSLKPRHGASSKEDLQPVWGAGLLPGVEARPDPDPAQQRNSVCGVRVHKEAHHVITDLSTNIVLDLFAPYLRYVIFGIRISRIRIQYFKKASSRTFGEPQSGLAGEPQWSPAK